MSRITARSATAAAAAAATAAATAALLLPVLLALTAPAAAQDSNVIEPVDSIEAWLLHRPFRIVDKRPSRGIEGERTWRAALAFDNGSMMVAKWAPAPEGGEAFNNTPRFEVAAYELQQLFLDPDDYVVPPTVARPMPLALHREMEPRLGPTFRGTQSVLVVLQYWLYNVKDRDFWDRDRFERDTAYARHFGDFNVLTYLVRHNDANTGNFLISLDSANPRVFSVDNGLAFSSEESDRGTEWRRLRVRRLPAATVQRLRAITEDDLARQLGTVAEFRIGPGENLEPVERTAPIDPNRGIRQTDDRVQLGLTQGEINAVWRRLQSLLRDVERGRIEVVQ